MGERVPNRRMKAVEYRVWEPILIFQVQGMFGHFLGLQECWNPLHLVLPPAPCHLKPVKLCGERVPNSPHSSELTPAFPYNDTLAVN